MQRILLQLISISATVLSFWVSKDILDEKTKFKKWHGFEK